MKMIYGIGFQAGEGLLVLEVQQKILGFLVRCAENILHDLLPLKPHGSIHPPLLTPASITEHNTQWPSVAATLAEAPYRVPVQFDFARVQALFDAKSAEAEDHIWSLREDPGYFQDVVRELGEHRYEHLHDVNGKTHSTLDKTEFWDLVEREVITLAYQRFIMWDLARKDLAEFARIRDQHGVRIHLTQAGHTEYEKAIYRLWMASSDLQHECLKTVQRYTPCSPPLRPYYYRIRNRDPNDIVGYDIQIKDLRMYNYFLWLLEHLVDEKEIEKCGLSELLDELDRVTRTSEGFRNSQHQPISGWIAACLSDLAVVSELQRQLNCHQPRVVPCCELDDEEVKQRLMTSFSVHLELHDAKLDFGDVGTPLTKFNYPSAKTHIATTVAQLHQAEEHLDIFWKRIDDFFWEKKQQTLHNYAGIVTVRELERTPEWVEPTPLPAPNEQQSAMVTELFSAFTIQEQSSEPEKISSMKVKVKTRGAVISSEVRLKEEPEIEIPYIPAPTIPVSKRALKVFSYLFHNPGQETLPGEIPWTDFLHALSSAGFSIEKQHGSAWLFTPPDLSRRPIIFHEPHPSSKTPIHIFRRHGRRLRLAYGWNIDTFSEEN